MLKRHKIEILLKAGHSKAEAARLAGISLRSVNRIAAEAPVVHIDDAAEREKRRIGRPFGTITGIDSKKDCVVGARAVSILLPH